MKQIIEIEVPEGKKAIWKDGKVVFEDIAPKLPETWEEFCELYPVKEEERYIGNTSIITFKGEDRSVYSDRNMLPSVEAASAHLALMQLHQLRDCYRQGWVPDWNDSCFNKYCIEFVEDKYTICVWSCYQHFLSFQSRELAEKFLSNFKNLIKQAGDLI